MNVLEPVPAEELPEDLAAHLAPRIERLGYLGGFFSHMAHQPQALLAFDRFTQSCKDALPPSVVEVIALSTATRLGNDYERHQHEQLCIRTGLSREWVSAVERLRPELEPGLSDLERLVQRFVLDAVDSVGNSAGPALARLVERSGAPMGAAVALMVARYLGHALIANACALAPPVPSIFEDPS